jgi:hypothetical protein
MEGEELLPGLKITLSRVAMSGASPKSPRVEFGTTFLQKAELLREKPLYLASFSSPRLCLFVAHALKYMATPDVPP